MVYTRPWKAAEAQVEDMGWTALGWFDHSGSEAVLVCKNGIAALVFRGTEFTRGHLGDIAANIGRPTKWAGPGRAHRGYVNALERIRFSAREMADKRNGGDKFFVTGHSLGGAMAVLYAAWATTQAGQRVDGLVTFGAPKSLSTQGCNAIRLNVRMVRQYYFWQDFAPWWPPSLILTNPGPNLRLSSPSWWPGPISSHGVTRYMEAFKLPS